MTQLIGILLLIVYSGGIWKFWKGFKRTNFNSSVSNRILLGVLWPVLVVINKSYRQNFQKALKG
jgi:hypothetical protein